MTVPSLEELELIESTQELTASQSDLNVEDISRINVHGDYDVGKLYDMLESIRGSKAERDKLSKAIWSKIEEYNAIPVEIKEKTAIQEPNIEEEIPEQNKTDDICEPKTEIQASKAIRDIVQNFLEQNIIDKLDYNEAILSCTFECNKKLNWGSPRAISRHIAVFCSKAALYEIFKENGTKFIRKRSLLEPN